MGDPVIIPASLTGDQIAARIGADKVAALIMQPAAQQVAMHEQALQPHAGRFPERAEVRLIAREIAAAAVRMARPNPDLITADQAILSTYFFGA